jgi:hypothetical protein
VLFVCLVPRAVRLFCALIPCAALPLLSAGAPKATWRPIPAEDLARTESVEPGAPAEILLRELVTNDREYPDTRAWTLYARYKIFAPDRCEALTRERVVVDLNAKADLRARLTLPDGTLREFGDADIQTRKFARIKYSLGDPVERFLAVEGVVPGAIVEFIKSYSGSGSGDNLDVRRIALQQQDIPARRLEFTYLYPNDPEYGLRVFAINAPTVVVGNDADARLIRVSAKDLPSIDDEEPFLGPTTDYCATLLVSTASRGISLSAGENFGSYIKDFDANAGPWSPFATILYAFQKVRAAPTRRVEKLAQEICAGAATPRERAERIHRHVQRLFETFVYTAVSSSSNRELRYSLDDVIDFENKRYLFIADMDFFWLAVALYESAGLNVRTVLLPDRRLARLEPGNVSQLFLQHVAAQVEVDGQWVFSHPLPREAFSVSDSFSRSARLSDALLPLGMLPWEHEGQVGLLGLENKQEFIEVPFAPASASVVANMGSFKVSPEGLLTGKARLRLTGHQARELRRALHRQTGDDQRHMAREHLRASFARDADVVIEKITGVDDPAEPLEVSYELRWPGFAVAAGDRLLLRPSVFRTQAGSPFASTTRRHPVHFQSRWSEVDRLGIQLPPGYSPEIMAEPVTAPGQRLRFEAACGYDAKRRLLTFNRDLVSEIIDVPVEAYADLKGFYDLIAAADRREMAAFRAEPAAGGN